jgi:membrane protein DedA with SNARE-associated domain
VTDTLLALVPEHGALVLFIATFLSCLAVPIPSSLLMLAAGAFVASGDLATLPVAGAALSGAVLGDQLGYGIGHSGGTRLWSRLLAGRKTGPPARRAARELHRRAGMTVYLSRWLFSALGPWVNFAAGATRIGWRRFSLASLLGETTWVALYIGLGIVFGARLEQVGATAGSVIGALAAGLVAVLLGRALWQRRHRTA